MNGLVVAVVEIRSIFVDVPRASVRDSHELGGRVLPHLMGLCDLFALLKSSFSPSTSCKVVSDFIISAQQVVWDGTELHRGATLEEKHVVS